MDGTEPAADAPAAENATRALPMPAWKRALDVALATAGLLALAPLWPLIAAAIKLEDGGPVFFVHRRVGRGLVPYRTRKFRSMSAGRTVRPTGGRPPPSEITRVGRLLRATALDESPQLWDVLRGRMSLVGPRPLMVEQVEAGKRGEAHDLRQVPGFYERHRVHPGLTGPAQVYGPWKISYRRKFRYDVFYVRRRSPGLDLELLARSVALSVAGLWPGNEEET